MQVNEQVVGNLSVDDDFMHPVSDDVAHNESMFFNMFDSNQNIGGFVRIGNRPNEGHAEMTFCMFLPDGDLLMQWGRIPISGNEEFRAGGMRFEVRDPGRTLGIEYIGKAVRIADPFEMRDPGKAMRSNPFVDVELRLDASALGPMIGDRTGKSPGAVIFLDGVGHYQQPYAANGPLVVDNQRWDLTMRGVRDHSWGRRVWSSLYQDRSIWISFGRELSFIVCKTRHEAGGAADEMGCVIENGVVTPLRSINIFSRFRPNSYYHDALRLELEDTSGRSFTLDGEVLAYVPLRHRSRDAETVYLGQAMTRFTFGDRETLGLSEYFDTASVTGSLIEHSKTGEFLAE